MSKINLAGIIAESEKLIDLYRYNQLKMKKNLNWSDCLSEEEWLSKLHHLRSLYKRKKITSNIFKEKEAELVIKWLAKFC